MTKIFCYASVFILYVLHQDFWFWDNGTLVFHILPVGLLYHVGYCVAASLILALLTWGTWPAQPQIEKESEDSRK